MNKLRAAVIFGLVALTCPASGQTAAELLQKGIYAQETVGDIDAAIRIYQQVLAAGSESRGTLAQAQYRLGVCLLRKGQSSEAYKAFDKLIANYPEQKELIAAAKAHSAGGLIAAPWSEGESLRLKLRLPTGIPIGMFIHTIEKSNGSTLVITSRTHVPGANHFSRSEVDFETMRPKVSSYRHEMLGEFKLRVSGKQARVESNGSGVKPLDITPLTFDNEAVVAMFRRLPLAEGYKAQFDVMSPLGTLAPITAEVSEITEIATKAGKFRAFKVEIPLIHQAFWISADANRYIVKMQTNGVTGELEEITRLDAAPVKVQDPSGTVAVTLPSPWAVLQDESGKPQTTTGLLDPEARCHCVLWAGKIDRTLREEIAERARKRAEALKGYKVRPDSWTPKQIDGVEALSVLADYEANNRKMIEYFTVLKRDNRGAGLFARVPAEKFAAFAPQFDRIVESARLQ